MEPVLFVDDDRNLVSALERGLQKSYDVESRTNAKDALAAVGETDFALVISDLRMPTMSGIELLTKIKDLAPDTVRILLTGNADLQAAIDAVNEGNIFRFLQKPCPSELLIKAIDAGLTQHRLLRAERDVLQQTLVGTVAALIEMLNAIEPAAFGRATRLRWCVRRLACELQVRDAWQLEAAAMLSQVDSIQTAGKVEHPRAQLGRRLLRQVPRLRTVAAMIERQRELVQGLEEQSPEAYTVALGAHILAVAIDFDQFIEKGFTFERALQQLQRQRAAYNADVLLAMEKLAREAQQADAAAALAQESNSTSMESHLFQPIATEVLRSLRG